MELPGTRRPSNARLFTIEKPKMTDILTGFLSEIAPVPRPVSSIIHVFQHAVIFGFG